jgi:arylsulfatase A-like enzyme
LSSTLDLLPTLLALAGVALPQERRFDGLDMAPVLFGGAATLHDSLLFR